MSALRCPRPFCKSEKLAVDVRIGDLITINAFMGTRTALSKQAHVVCLRCHYRWCSYSEKASVLPRRKRR